MVGGYVRARVCARARVCVWGGAEREEKHTISADSRLPDRVDAHEALPLRRITLSPRRALEALRELIVGYGCLVGGSTAHLPRGARRQRVCVWVGWAAEQSSVKQYRRDCSNDAFDYAPARCLTTGRGALQNGTVFQYRPLKN